LGKFGERIFQPGQHSVEGSSDWMKFARPRRFTHAFIKMIGADAFERLRHLL